MDYDAGA
jgi:hypothetical protein